MEANKREQRIRSLALRTLAALAELIDKVRDPDARDRLREQQIRLQERLRRTPRQ